jgi:hypothetical protein
MSRHLKTLSPFVDWDKIHDEYLIASYSKESRKKRDLRQRARIPRHKGQRRHQWQLAMIEAKVGKQEEEAINDISFYQQDISVMKGERLRPKRARGSKAEKEASHKDKTQYQKELPNENAWAEVTPPSNAPISGLPVALKSVSFPSVTDKPKANKKNAGKHGINVQIIPTNPPGLLNSFSEESPAAPSAPLGLESLVSGASSFFPSDSNSSMKNVSKKPITADGKSSKQSIDKDEFPLQANGKIIEGDSVNELVGDILEDAKSAAIMDQRQGDEASFNGKPIPIYTYDKGNCPDVGDVASLPCAPDDLEKLCDKYDDMGSFRKCFDACKPSFCCIHGKSLKILS